MTSQPALAERVAEWKEKFEAARGADRISVATIESLNNAARLIGELSQALGLGRRFACVPEPGEPSFMLLARDPAAAALVEIWGDLRAEFVRLGVKPREDMAKVIEARALADAMRDWRKMNRPPAPAIGVPAEGSIAIAGDEAFRQRMQAEMDAAEDDQT